MKEYFTLSQRERLGIIVLIVLIVLVMAIQYSVHYLAPAKAINRKTVDSALALLKNGKGAHDENAYFSQLGNDAVVDNAKTEANIQPFSINKITENGLLQMGVSPYVTKNLVKYRDILGGYSNLGQMKDVFGIDSITLKIITQYGKFNSEEIHKIDINHVLTADLARHPYFRYHHLANAIVQYREQHGDYKDISDLKNILTIDEETYKKIAPYVVIKL